MAHRERADPEKALADLNEALRLNPGDAQAFWGRGAVAFDRNEYDKAIADFSAVIRLSPSDPNGYQGRARAYAAVGDQQKAAADEQRAKELRSGEEKRP
jgi:tetratricopeptide (TPR) repeat protein